MLSQAVSSLIIEEQSRRGDLLAYGVDLDAYLAKLGQRAEILSVTQGERCCGLVAFYCNNHETKEAYITLVVVDPRDRGRGPGRTLVTAVLEIARHRGFGFCRLEVAQANVAARGLYQSIGFRPVESREDRLLLEIGL